MTDETVRRIDPGEEFAYLGQKGPESREYSGLDSFPTPEGAGIIRMTSDEVTSMCPITGQPDFEVVDITYAPRERCLESKALKLYLASLRNTAGFIEALAVEIAREVAQAIEPRWIRVDTTQKARGGITIVASVALLRNAEGEYEAGQSWVPSPPPFNHYLGH